jgi:hypothetical protein
VERRLIKEKVGRKEVKRLMRKESEESSEKGRGCMREEKKMKRKQRK